MPIDMTAATKAPPRKSVASGTRTPRASSSPATTQSDRGRRTEGLNGLAQLGQGLLLMARQYADAAAVGMHAPNLAPELAALADDYAVVAAPIDFMIKVGPFGTLIAAAVPFALQIMANHKLIDASQIVGSNVVAPEVLEAQMRAQMIQMQADAKRTEQEAMAAFRAAEQDLFNMASLQNAKDNDLTEKVHLVAS